MSRFYIMLFLAAWVTGCGSIPLAERQKNATTEVSEKWSRDQKERLGVALGALERSPDGGTVEWSVDSSEAGNGDQSLLGGLESSIPGGIKLIYAGIGILLVLFAVKQVAKSSSAVKAALGAADAALAKQVRRLEGRLEGNGLTPDDKNTILAQLRALEKDRGKLR